jgi:ubiquinone/menaquinone biosynthesis C-methylase UbiE
MLHHDKVIMNDSRWRYAQESEKNYWKSRKEWIDDDRNSKAYWNEILALGYQIHDSFFNDKNILEIGCGPAGAIFSLDSANERVGIEPLDLSNLLKGSWKLNIIKKGTGENIPCNDKQFNVVICFNALDHSIDPDKVIKEAYRILSDDGEFLLWLHVLKPRFKFLTPLLNKIDSPHPHHFTADDVLKLISSNNFMVTYKKLFRGLGPITKSKIIPHKNNIKSKIGSLMMDDLWLRVRKNNII